MQNAEHILKGCDDKLAAMDEKLELHKSELEKLIDVHEKQRGARGSVMSCSDISWVCQASSGNAFCDICSEYSGRLPVGAISGSARRSNWLKQNGGVEVDQNHGNFKKTAIKHAHSDLHAACVEARSEEEEARRLDGAFGSIRGRELSAMERLFKILHLQINEKRSLRSYETLVHLVDECDCDVGHKEHSRKM